MIRMQTNVVLKYFERLDAFVKIRIFTPEEISELLRTSSISNRKSYYDLVLNACVISYSDHVLPAVAHMKELVDRFAVDQQLYELCTEVNPGLDIRKVTIPVAEQESSELHLLEAPLAIHKRDFRQLKNMEEKLSNRIIGQEEIVGTVCKAIKKAMTGLRDENHPIATFMFVGQTGVGKTELAKALTRYLYEDLSRMIRIDCSEFSQPHEYAKLIGAPPGYIGHDQGGMLCDALRAHGSTVVLFDEIEKSDVKVHDLLLQAMDEGFITDNKGRRAPFNEAILVLTSNVGAGEIEAFKNRIGFDWGHRGSDQRAILQETLESVKRHFKPEFINRLTDILVFNSIGLEECKKIVINFLGEVQKHASGVPLRVEYEPDVPHFLAERGYKPEYGARELKRTVEREVEEPLSELLIDGRVKEGDRITLKVRRHRLMFHRN